MAKMLCQTPKSYVKHKFTGSPDPQILDFLQVCIHVPIFSSVYRFALLLKIQNLNTFPVTENQKRKSEHTYKNLDV